MKNEERILELLSETLQRIDRHSEQFERLEEENKRINERIERIEERMENQQEQIGEKREQMWTLIAQIQKHQERLDQQGDALIALKKRDEVIHQSSLEQQKAYQAMTELLMHHNRILTAKGIL